MRSGLYRYRWWIYGIVAVVALAISIMVPPIRRFEKRRGASPPPEIQRRLLAIAAATREYLSETGQRPYALDDLAESKTLRSITTGGTIDFTEDVWREITYTPECLGRTSVILAYEPIAGSNDFAVLYFFTDHVELRTREQIEDELQHLCARSFVSDVNSSGPDD